MVLLLGLVLVGGGAIVVCWRFAGARVWAIPPFARTVANANTASLPTASSQDTCTHARARARGGDCCAFLLHGKRNDFRLPAKCEIPHAYAPSQDEILFPLKISTHHSAAPAGRPSACNNLPTSSGSRCFRSSQAASALRLTSLSGFVNAASKLSSCCGTPELPPADAISWPGRVLRGNSDSRWESRDAFLEGNLLLFRCVAGSDPVRDHRAGRRAHRSETACTYF